jgi:hypothetical protein
MATDISILTMVGHTVRTKPTAIHLSERSCLCLSPAGATSYTAGVRVGHVGPSGPSVRDHRRNQRIDPHAMKNTSRLAPLDWVPRR